MTSVAVATHRHAGIGIQKKKRSDLGQRHGNPEAQMQMRCVAWCDEHGYLVDGSPGGAAFMKGAHKARGCRPGRADLLLFKAGADGSHGLAVELKIGSNTLQPAQVDWLERIRNEGWRTGVARSLEEFKSIVVDHVAIVV